MDSYELHCRLNYANFRVDYRYFRHIGHDHWDALFLALDLMQV